MTLVLAMMVLGTLTACGNESTAERENSNAVASQKESSRQENESGQENQPEQNVSTHGNVLVACFAVAENSDVDMVSSASVSDVDDETKRRMTALAEMIQEKTSGGLFLVKTSVKYSGDGGKLICRFPGMVV